MTQSETMMPLSPDTLFVIACPVCRGHIAATGSLGGRDACCPLCANLFRVPMAMAPVGMRAPPPPTVAEDWGRVIETLVPPGAKTEPPAAKPESAPIFEVASDTRSESEQRTPEVPDPATPIEASAPPTDWIDTVLQSADSPESSDSLGESTGIPNLVPVHAPPDQKDIELREPVRTVRHGDAVIEIRRLSPQERRARRLRRNLMLIVIGVSILLAIVVVFGLPAKPVR